MKEILIAVLIIAPVLFLSSCLVERMGDKLFEDEDKKRQEGLWGDDGYEEHY